MNRESPFSGSVKVVKLKCTLIIYYKGYIIYDINDLILLDSLVVQKHPLPVGIMSDVTSYYVQIVAHK